MRHFFAAFLSALLALFATTSLAQTVFGNAQGWQVSTVRDNGFTGCRAVHNQLDGAAEILLSSDGRDWMLAFEMATPQGVVPAQLVIDNRRFSLSATGRGNRVSFAPSLEMMSLVRSGMRMTMSVQGGMSFTSTLQGSSAAMSMLQSCIRGRAAAAPAPAPAGGGQGAPSLANLNCPTFSNFASQPSNAVATLQFSNFASVPLTLFWINFNGGLQPYAVIQPGQAFRQSTFIGHNWVARTGDGFCMGGLIRVDRQTVSLSVN